MSTDAQHYQYPIPRSMPTDPPEEYAQLRAEKPVCPITLATGDPAMIVTRYSDIKTVLSDTRFSRSALFVPGAPRAQLAEPDQDSLISMDPPRHTKLRNMINRAFGPRRVALMRPRMQALTDELLDDMIKNDQRPLDLNEHLILPLALRVICDLIGVPFEDRSLFPKWTDHFMSLNKYPVQAVIQANTEMRTYLSNLIDSKREAPGDDLLSELVQQGAEKGEDQYELTQNELVSLAVILLLAGHDTTVTSFGGSVVTLLKHPEQLRELSENPDLWPQAIEELVRLNTPGDGSFIRITLEDVELSDTVIPKGTAVLAPISAADRDPEVFAEPDAFDIKRDHNPHIGFGYGTHFCVGSALARAELHIALSSLFSRIPTLQLAIEPSQLQWRQFAALGGYDAIPVTW